jgi:hypothetical protein
MRDTGCSCPSLGQLDGQDIVYHVKGCRWIESLDPEAALAAGYVTGLQKRLFDALDHIRRLDREVKRLREGRFEEPET